MDKEKVEVTEDVYEGDRKEARTTSARRLIRHVLIGIALRRSRVRNDISDKISQ